MFKNGKMDLYTLLFFVCSFCFTTSLQAAGIQFYEFGTPILGTAAVGQTVTKDASSSYLNPAAMSLLDSSQIMLGSELIITKTQFVSNDLNTFNGNNGGNAGSLQPGMGVFAVMSYCPDLKFGLSIASPFGGALDYNNGWVGRYFVQTTTLLTLDVTPSVSYSFNDWVSIGAGAFVEYANLAQKIGIPVRGPADGQADMRLHHYAPGFILGVLFTPTCDTQFGISYRSRVNHKLKGGSTFLAISAAPEVTATLNLPQSIIASLNYDCTEQLSLLAEAGWSNWHIFKNTVITINNITLAIPRKWKDTYRFGAGARYQLTPKFLFQLGASFDSSPCKTENRLPDLPVDKQLRLGTGIVYSTCESLFLSLNYEYIKFGKASIDKDTRIGRLAGKYKKNLGHFFGISINYKL